MQRINKISFLLIIIILLQPLGFTAKGSNDIPSDFCISSQEFQMLKLINDFRIKNRLPAVRLSKSLSYVAYNHTRDLYNHHPDEDFCNLHSWSQSDRWKSCCYTKDPTSQSCMNEKPKELTQYSFPGYELIYYESDSLDLQNVMDFWRKNTPTSDFFLNTGNWAKYKWSSMGVSIYKGYVSVWVGAGADIEGSPAVCDSKISSDSLSFVNPQKSTIVIDTIPTGRFHLISGSYPTLKEAKKSIEKAKLKGFNDVRIIKRDKTFRISLCSYASLEAAKKAKEKLKLIYKNIWVLKF
jgi:hypothetical protein